MVRLSTPHGALGTDALRSRGIVVKGLSTPHGALGTIDFLQW